MTIDHLTIDHLTIDHLTLTRMAAEGNIQGAQIIGQPGGWGILVQSGTAECVLAAKRGATRQFARFETLVAYLKKLGIVHFKVDTSQYAPVDPQKQHVRADAAQRMRHAHEAAEYDKWFRAEMEEAMAEADDPATVWIDHATATQQMAEERAALLALIKAQKA